MTFDHAKGSIKVPGKMLLSGEYVVLDGSPALSFAVNRWLKAKWQFRETKQDKGMLIDSNLWPEPRFFPWHFHQEEVSPTSIENAVISCFKKAVPGLDLNDLLELHVSSELQPNLGLGSSSAYCLALSYALCQTIGKSHEETSQLAKNLAYEAQRLFQGGASGYDIATQTCGGLLEFQVNHDSKVKNWEPHILPLPECRQLPSCLHFISNRKGAETKKLVKGGLAFMRQRPALQRALQDNADRLSSAFKAAFSDPETSQLEPLIQACAEFRRLFSETPMFPVEAAEALSAIAGCDQTWSFKTTGAGGEDCFIVVAPVPVWQEIFKDLQGLGFEEVELQLNSTGWEIIG